MPIKAEGCLALTKEVMGSYCKGLGLEICCTEELSTSFLPMLTAGAFLTSEDVITEASYWPGPGWRLLED